MLEVSVKGHIFIFCEKTYELYRSKNWRLSEPAPGYFYLKRNYLKSEGCSGTASFHREALSLSKGDGLQVDHINGNTRDNRLENLRVVSPIENYRNRRKLTAGASQYIGVSKYTRYKATWNKWRAFIRIDGKAVQLGTYATEIEAARARDEAAKLHYGCFTKLNFET